MTSADRPRHRRRSIRLPEYDYGAAGAYFLTICTQDRRHLFGRIANGRMYCNPAGRIVSMAWEDTARIRTRVRLDAFVVMPDHFHAILVIEPCWDPWGHQPTREEFGRPTSGTVPTIIRSFKAVTTKRINQWRNTPGTRVWQRNYYERVIRDQASMDAVRRYIAMNPAKWPYRS